jgi:uncharacterized protein YoxC
MTIGTIAGVAAALAFIILVIFIIPILLEFRKTVERVNDFIASTEREVMPTLNKLQTTVEEINDELAKVNETTASVQQVTKRVDNIANLVHEVVSNPLIKVASYSAGMSGAVRTFLGNRPKKRQ